MPMKPTRRDPKAIKVDTTPIGSADLSDVVPLVFIVGTFVGSPGSRTDLGIVG